MSNIDNVMIDNSEFDIADSTARNNITALQEQVNSLVGGGSNNNVEALIDKMLMIGDSTCEGLVSDYPYLRNRNPRWSSSEYISKMTGWEVQNDGHYSWNAVDWINDKYETGTYGTFQIATIEFGYNGVINNTIDTDVSPYSDWRNYRNTGCGNYCKIIGILKEENPNLIIMPVVQANAVDTTKATIKAIANYFNLNYIDLSITDLNERKYHGYYSEANMNDDVVDYTHFNILGYSRKAQVMRKQILDYLSENAVSTEQIISKQQSVQYPDQPSN